MKIIHIHMAISYLLVKFLKGFYLKLVQSINASKNITTFGFQNGFSPDEVFDVYVDFSEDYYLQCSDATLIFNLKLALIFNFKAYFLLLFLENWTTVDIFLIYMILYMRALMMTKSITTRL